jgi:predicted transporter
MSASGLALYFPDESPYAVAGLFAAFVVIASVSALTVILGRKRNADPIEASLGAGMLMIGAYFMISALVMPQFSEVSKVYRLASYSREARTGDSAAESVMFCVILGVMSIGFLFARWHSKKLRTHD